MSNRSSKSIRTANEYSFRTRASSSTESRKSTIPSEKSKMPIRKMEEKKLDVGDELESVYQTFLKMKEDKDGFELLIHNLTRQGLDINKLREKVHELIVKNDVDIRSICIFLMGTMINGTNFNKWLKKIPETEVRIIIEKFIKNLEIKQKVSGASNAITPTRLFLVFPYATALVLVTKGVKFMGYSDTVLKLFASTAAISYLNSDKDLSEDYKRAGSVLHYALQYCFFSKVPENKAQKQSFLIWLQEQKMFFEVQKGVKASEAVIDIFREFLKDFTVDNIEEVLQERVEISSKSCRGALF